MRYIKYLILIIFILSLSGCINIRVIEGDFNSTDGSREYYYETLEEALNDGAISKDEYENIKIINKH